MRPQTGRHAAAPEDGYPAEEARTAGGPLHRGRAAFARRAWAEAHAQLSAADQETPLAPDDLERLATAACLVGSDEASTRLWARAHRECRGRGDVERAARCAFWLAFGLLNRGEHARAGGWLARARRLLATERHDCVVHGYLLFPEALRCILGGDPAQAHATFARAAEIGERFGDADLVALARHGRGRALIRLGEVEEGVELLDEAMAAVEAGEVSPIVAGDVYCSVIEACHEIFDLRRAQEWTAALQHWCESQPDLIPYRGQCMVRHAEILQMHGDWPTALGEAQRACEWLSRPPPQRAVGSAHYQSAEIHRLRGEFDQAEQAYRLASQWGRKPQPGLALLRLAQGQVDAAEAATRRAVDEATDRRTRSRLLPAHVEVMLAAGDVAAARSAASELAEIAGDVDTPLLRAVAGQAEGAVLLAEGDARASLPVLRRAGAAWQDLAAPYEAARVRLLVGVACRELGDQDTAAMEFEAARSVFLQLSAAPDLARLEQLAGAPAAEAAGGLTERETQVLRLVAAGQTNRAIAAELFISERTVERHVSNILTKLGLSSRSAATAFAYQNHLL